RAGERRAVVVAQAEVQRELLAHLPVILHEGGVLTVVEHGAAEAAAEVPEARAPEQQRCQLVALPPGKLIRGGVVADVEGPGRENSEIVVLAAPPGFRADLERVAAGGAGQRVADVPERALEVAR